MFHLAWSPLATQSPQVCPLQCNLVTGCSWAGACRDTASGGGSYRRVWWYTPVTEDRAWSGATSSCGVLAVGLLSCGCTITAPPTPSCMHSIQASEGPMPGVCKHTAGGASTECVRDSRGSRWLLILVQPQRAELVARVVSGLPRGQGRGSGERLRRLASVNVDICGGKGGEIFRVSRAPVVGHGSFFSGEGCRVCL